MKLLLLAKKGQIISVSHGRTHLLLQCPHSRDAHVPSGRLQQMHAKRYVGERERKATSDEEVMGKICGIGGVYQGLKLPGK